MFGLELLLFVVVVTYKKALDKKLNLKKKAGNILYLFYQINEDQGIPYLNKCADVTVMRWDVVDKSARFSKKVRKEEEFI